MSELSERVAAASRISDALTILAYRIDAADSLAAGVSDVVGYEVSPSGAARWTVAWHCMMAAAQSRTLTQGDAQFLHEMVGDFIVEVSTVESAAFALQNVRRHMAAGDEAEEFARSNAQFREFFLMAQADRDENLTESFGPVLGGLVAQFFDPWEGLDLHEPLAPESEWVFDEDERDSWDGRMEPESADTIYPRGSLRDRFTRWLYRSSDRMDRASARMADRLERKERERRVREQQDRHDRGVAPFGVFVYPEETNDPPEWDF